MDFINEDTFDETEVLPEEEDNSKILIEEKDILKLLQDLEQPVGSMKKIAAKLQIYIDAKIKQEVDSTGYISESTRKMLHEYNDLLDKIQKALHGEKKTLDGTLTHAQVGSMIRQYANDGETIIKVIESGN